ncbi:MAG: hypothetical protein WKG07_12445 [Hymenobacter sp.]
MQANPNFTPAQVTARLIATARDINAVGFDALTGAGLINAYDAVFGPQTSALAPFVETLDTQTSIAGLEPARQLLRPHLGAHWLWPRFRPRPASCWMVFLAFGGRIEPPQHR